MFCPKCGNQNADTNKFCKKCGRKLPVRGNEQAVPNHFGVPQSAGFVGQVLDGKYRIDAKLGTGGMGDVYRATRILIGDAIAVKILHPHLARDPQSAERFRREAVTATKLKHRNVVGLYDVGILAGYLPYILMELAEGFTLRQIIKQYQVLPLDFVVTVAAQVCSALTEAHELGIVHRDIKPENIVANQTTTGWQVKVLDFGIAKLYDQGDIGLTIDGTAMGTPQYMSPEQCMGERLDARSDIYSVGIMLYEMLTGTVPFKSPTASAVAVHQVQTEPQPLRTINPDIHPDVEAVILKSLAKQREPRQQKASQLAQELIQAATAAFKSGFTEVSLAPIPIPDSPPDIGQADENALVMPGGSRSEEEAGEASPPDDLSVEAEAVAARKTEAAEKPKRRRSRKKNETIADSESDSGPPETPLVAEFDSDDPSHVAETQLVTTAGGESTGSAGELSARSNDLATKDIDGNGEDVASEASVDAGEPIPDTSPDIQKPDENSLAGSGDSGSDEGDGQPRPNDVSPDKVAAKPRRKTGSTKKAKPRRAKKKPEETGSDEISADPNSQEAISDTPDTPPAGNEISEDQSTASETQVVNAPGGKDADAASADDLSERSNGRATKDKENDSSDGDVVRSDIVGPGEHALDGNLPTGSEPVDDDARSTAAPADSPQEADAETVQPGPNAESSAQIKDSEGVPTFGHFGESEGKNRSLLIVIALAVIALLAVAVGVAYFIPGSQNGGEDSNPQPSAVAVEPPPGMALVTGGSFIMGEEKGGKREKDPSQAKSVTVESFYMDIYEVTREEYKKFIDAEDYPPPKVWKDKNFPAGTAKFPVTDVDWDGANAFAKWAGKRLPTEAEWEFAARGTDGRRYTWGPEWKSGMANADNVNKGMVEVGKYKGASPFGIFDLVGNAWEWTADDFVADAGKKQSGTAKVPLKVIRGGCFLSRRKDSNAIIRGAWPVRGGVQYVNTGFRCAKDLPPGLD